MEQFRSQFEPEPIQPPASRFRRLIWELFTTIVPALIIALFVNVFVAEAAEVEEGPSMQPNLYVGYRMMTEKVSYRFHDPQRGDIVVAEQPDGQPSLVKRVIGLPGETIELRDGHTYINGERISEPWIVNFGQGDFPPTQIPANHVFLIGDNRPVSRDSRAIGPVPIDDIRGRVIFIYWPLAEFEIFP